MSNLVHEIHDSFCTGAKVVIGALLALFLLACMIAGILISFGLLFSTEQTLIVMDVFPWCVYGLSIFCWVTLFGFIIKSEG